MLRARTQRAFAVSGRHADSPVGVCGKDVAGASQLDVQVTLLGERTSRHPCVV